ncbi:MAG: Heme-binding protein, partial [Chthoniobacter sp.]|nr:Heme-binding protein [Chthoniobacter sp.]
MSFPKAFPLATALLLVLSSPLSAQAPAAPIPPVVNDPALRIELIATVPEVEACTTVCSDPHGAIYVGNDPRDGRLNTKEPVCTIVRFGIADRRSPNGDSKGASATPSSIANPQSPIRNPRTRTVFADKLYSPAGSAWHDGWLYVIHDPFMSRFKDTDGDGVADVREDLISNLGIAPNPGLNDHVVSGFTLGMDGFWYISVGDRGIYQAKSAKDGSTITMQGGGIARCRTDGTQLEVFSTGTRNHLGVNLDAEDNAFTRDNTDDGNGWWTRLTHHIEGGYYGYPYDYRSAPNYGVTQPSEQTLSAIKQHGGAAEIHNSEFKIMNSPFLSAMADFGGGSPTGGFCYLSDGLPEKYRGKHFFSEWGKSGLFVTEVARDGATFKFVSDTKLVEAAKGGEFRPMQSSVAADGSILIADWGYGGWKGPKVAGAVWRVYWSDAKPAPRLADESKASIDELIAALGHPDREQRLRAQWALAQEKSEPLVGKLTSLLKDEGVPTIRRLHALWTLEGTARSLKGQRKLVQSSQTTSPNLGDLERVSTEAILGATAKYAPRTDVNASIRAQAIRASAQLRDFRALVFDDPVPAVRLQSLIAHARYLGEPTSAVSQAQLLDIGEPTGSTTDQLDRRMAKAERGELQQGAEVVELLNDPDSFVRLAAGRAIAFESLLLPFAIRDQRQQVSRVATSALGKTFREHAVRILAHAVASAKAELRSRAVANLGYIAYQPKPYDGHWWGTQPVKTSPAPNSVAWEGTPRALGALITALADAESSVRLSAAKAFASFVMDEANAARAALRSRLTAETDPPVRQQLVAALGVQKDAGAMEVFRQIALDEKADASFRETAIGAVVNIGGDAAKKTLAQLATAELSTPATLKVIEAVGTMKVLEAAGGLLVRLQSPDATVRAAAAKAAGALGAQAAAKDAAFAAAAQHSLVIALEDKESKVQVAAIEAIGALKIKAALPALISLAEKRRAKREAIEAIAKMPDESAIPVLVESLREKDGSIRRNAIKALKGMREKALPQVEALLASGRVPEELVPEIRNAFESGAMTKWKMIGVFENVWEAVHPPEQAALAAGGIPDLTAKYHNAEGKDVGWIDVTADSEIGRVDLEKLFKSNAMVCAYAHTEIDAPEATDAKLFTSADDELGIWLNGARVLNQAGNHGFEPDKNETPLQLRAGKNHLFLKIGNKGGGWVFHARMPGFDDGKFLKSKEPTPEEKQRLFALATKPDGTWINPGDAKRGEKLFHDPAAPMAAICATCHVVKGKGGQIGPDLSAVGTKYKRPDLIASIHEPSKTIALGFEQEM